MRFLLHEESRRWQDEMENDYHVPRILTTSNLLHTKQASEKWEDRDLNLMKNHEVIHPWPKK